jgi:oligopeptidase B
MSDLTSRPIAAPGGAPVAARRPHELEAHGKIRADDWWWLRERDNPEVIAYLEAENEYARALLEPTAALQERLFEQIKARVQEDDVSVPSRRRGWWYWSSTAEGDQYRTHRRLADPERLLGVADALESARAGRGEVILDENALGAGSDYFALGVLDVTSDQGLMAYAIDLDGSERYRLRFRDLTSG